MRIAIYTLCACALIALTLAMLLPPIRSRVQQAIFGRRTVAQAIAACDPRALPRVRQLVVGAGLTYPPGSVVLVAYKAERRLDVHVAGDERGTPVLAASYPILAASGVAGPKTREGDRQVPEGVYAIESLNPNSAYHLALRVNYPNADDIQAAHDEGRDPSSLGSDIMIHGKSVSIGCLAMGDAAIEELFILANDTGLARVRLLIVPHDLRSTPAPTDARPWLHARYAALAKELARLSP